MSAVIYGLSDIDVIPQSDFRASQTENGGWTGSQSFKFKKGSLDQAAVQLYFQGGKRATQLDPNCDQFYSFLRLLNISDVQTVESGYTQLTCNYAGFYTGSIDGSGEQEPLPTYSLRGATSEAPLHEHSKWKALSDTEKWALGLLMNGDAISSTNFTQIGSYDPENFIGFSPWVDSTGAAVTLAGDSLEFAKRIAQGKTTYKFATYTWTERKEGETGLTESQLNALSKITNPPGSPPTPGLGRTWMLTDVNQEQYGSGEYKFTKELSFLLSDEGGHDDFLQSST